MLLELPYRRLLILTEGCLGVFSSKTAAVLLRYRCDDCVGVLDSVHAGQPIREVLGDAPDVPVVASVADALALKPDALVVGIAPPGGALPEAMRRHLGDVLRAGISVISGLHTMLGDDPELAELAERSGARIHDVRDPGPIRRIGSGKARSSRAKRVLTVGTDCGVGKMLTALELHREAVRQGFDSAFVPTGQTGMMLEGWGIAVDHVLSDFVSGAVELLVEHVANKDLCFVEGQGSIEHPAYSAVTLGLLHGTCPDAMVICHRPGRSCHDFWEDCPVAPIATQIDLYERMLAPLHPGKVVAVAVNTVGMSPDEADAVISQVRDETGLVAVDPVRHGCGALFKAVGDHLAL